MSIVVGVQEGREREFCFSVSSNTILEAFSEKIIQDLGLSKLPMSPPASSLDT